MRLRQVRHRIEDAIAAERERCARHVTLGVWMLRRGAGQSRPWDRLDQALEKIRHAEPADGPLYEEAAREVREAERLELEALRAEWRRTLARFCP